MPSCIVKGCKFSWKRKDPDIIIHSFPRSRETIRAWLLQTGQDFGDIDAFTEKVFEGKKTDAYRICSQHFTADCYMQDGVRKSLKKDALPTVFDCVLPAPSATRTERTTDGFTRSHRMGKKRKQMTERILNLTLEIIYLLTGEDYTIVKVSNRVSPDLEVGFIGTPTPILVPPPRSVTQQRKNDKKILKLTYKMVSLLTGEELDRAEGLNPGLSKHNLNEGPANRIEDSDIYTSTIDHTRCPSAHIKAEPVLCDGGNLTDVHIPAHHPSPDTEEEPVLCDTAVYTPTDHTQHTLAIIKEEQISCEEQRGTDITPTLTEPVDYSLIHIKEETDEDCSPLSNTHYTSSHIGELGHEDVLQDTENICLKENDTMINALTFSTRGSTMIYKCSKCPERFTSVSHLHKHLIAHKTRQTFICGECGKSYSSHTSLTNHRLVHMGQKPFPCSECGKSFRCKSHLISHARIHREDNVLVL